MEERIEQKKRDFFSSADSCSDRKLSKLFFGGKYDICPPKKKGERGKDKKGKIIIFVPFAPPLPQRTFKKCPRAA